MKEDAVIDHTTDRRKSGDRQRAAFAAAKAAPAEHVPRLVTTRHGRQQVHGAGVLGRFNSALAVVVTKAVGTMWAAYIFVLIAVVSLPAAIASHNTIVIVAWIAQTFLQLVLLPIIIVGQNVISASQDARAEADHITLTTLHAMNVRQLQMLEQQSKILGQQQQILELLEKKGA
jgi:hypothetical protein